MPAPIKPRALLPSPPLEKHKARLCNDNSDHFCWGRAHRCGFSHVCNLGDGAEHLFFLMGVLWSRVPAAEFASPSRHRTSYVTCQPWCYQSTFPSSTKLPKKVVTISHFILQVRYWVPGRHNGTPANLWWSQEWTSEFPDFMFIFILLGRLTICHFLFLFLK